MLMPRPTAIQCSTSGDARLRQLKVKKAAIASAWKTMSTPEVSRLTPCLEDCSAFLRYGLDTGSC